MEVYGTIMELFMVGKIGQPGFFILNVEGKSHREHQSVLFFQGFVQIVCWILVVGSKKRCECGDKYKKVSSIQKFAFVLKK